MNFFKYLIGLTALLVAGCAAYFSVKGIATLFAGAFVATLVMAGALEIGKLVSVSYLKREWKSCGLMLKWYLNISVIVLMFITSLGIFGFLSSAYQDSALKHELHMSKIESVKNRKDLVEGEVIIMAERIKTLTHARQSQEKRLDDITAKIGKSMTASSAQRLQESTQKLIEQSSIDITNAQNKLDKLTDQKIKLEEDIMAIKLDAGEAKDIQTFDFVANEFDMTLDSVAKWFIIIIIFVFDPLAVALVLAYNSMDLQDRKRKKAKQIEKELKEIENTVVVEKEVIKEVPVEKIVEKEVIVEKTPEQIEKEKQILKLKNIHTKSGKVTDKNGNIIAES
jgi:hypothetical protein